MVMNERHSRKLINQSSGHRWRCQMTGIMLSFLLVVVVEAPGPRREDNHWQSQALKEEEDRLEAEAARLEQEIAQLQQDEQTLDRQTNVLLGQDGPLKDELGSIKRSIIDALRTVQVIPNIANYMSAKIRSMGALDLEKFEDAFYEVQNQGWRPEHRYNPGLSFEDNFYRVFSSLGALARSSQWNPFRVDPESETYVHKTTDKIRERVRDVWGDKICDILLQAKFELLEYNPSGNYPVPIPWNPRTEKILEYSEVIQQFGDTIRTCEEMLGQCICPLSQPPVAAPAPRAAVTPAPRAVVTPAAEPDNIPLNDIVDHIMQETEDPPPEPEYDAPVQEDEEYLYNLV